MSETGLFSVVVAVYGVESYIEEFLASLEQQQDFEDLDVILVNDGSRDRCGEILDAWVARHPTCARVVHKENGGVCSARNAGLELARNTWVTFCDPDDILSPDYFEQVRSFLAHYREPDVCLLATKEVRLNDATGEIRDTHPLRARFASGNQLVDMDRFPTFIHLASSRGFYRTQSIKELGLRFDSRVKPVFEDAHFTLLYLIAQPKRLVGAVASARYLYRRREANDSLMNTAWGRDERYLNVPLYGYLAALRHAAQRLGHAPLWAQNTVVYDLMSYFTNDIRTQSPVKVLTEEQTEAFHETVSKLFDYIDVSTIEDYSIQKIPWSIKHAVLAAYKNEGRFPNYIQIRKIDHEQRVFELVYRFSGDRPQESFLIRGKTVTPIHAKTRSIVLMGRALEHERIVWLPLGGTLRVELNGIPVPLSRRWRDYDKYTIRPSMLEKTPGSRRDSRTSVTRDPSSVQSCRRRAAARRIKRLASTHLVAKHYRDAWVLMDRDSRAGDNAEHLYAHIAEQHPDVNAFFVLRKDSVDWLRLKKRGFRLIPYGSFRWHLLLLNARHLISSHVDNYVVRPLDKSLFGPPQWRYTFLQHGVTKDDLSRWLNGKPIDLILTATRPEYESIVANGTPYVLSTHETRLTGFPRWDALLRKSQARPMKDLVVIMPTWRRTLVGEQLVGGNDRAAVDGFLESDYAMNWLALLDSSELKDCVQSAGLRLAFMPHPNMKPYLDSLRTRLEGIEILGYDTSDVQEVLAQARLVVTDYSSIAFDAAYVGCPIVYFQFDRDHFFAGGHIFRPGYFDYKRDGFGPVAEDAESALAEVCAIVEGRSDESTYRTRREATFELRDGQACARTVQAIKDLTRRYSKRVTWPHESLG